MTTSTRPKRRRHKSPPPSPLRLPSAPLLLIISLFITLYHHTTLTTNSYRRSLLGPPILTPEQLSRSLAHRLLPPDELGPILIWGEGPYRCIGRWDEQNGGTLENGEWIGRTDRPYDAVGRLLARQKGKLFALLRDPRKNTDTGGDNPMVRVLVGKHPEDRVNIIDLQMAKELLGGSVVGLEEEMEESWRRFLGASGETGGSACLREFFEEYTEPVAVDPVDNINEAGIELDVALYAYVVKLFREHDGIYNLYPQDLEIDESENEEQKNDNVMVMEGFEADSLNGEGDLDSQELQSLPPATNTSTLHTQNDTYIPLQLTLQQRERAILLTHLSNTSTTTSAHSTPFFWHVPKAGGTTIQNLYWCMGLTLANEVGANKKFKVRRDVLTAYRPWKTSGNNARVINVDVTTHKGILHAKELGFLSDADPTHTDILSSSLFFYAAQRLFSPDRPARMFALFRHPVERAVSKFYYLARASWEPTYDERWANMTLEEWSTQDWGESNWLVKQLSGKKFNQPVDMADLEFAKEVIRSKFTVGLMNRFEESVHRFDVFLGVDETTSMNKKCIDDFLHNDRRTHLSNTNSHAEAERGSPAWIRLSKINALDGMLYRFIEEQFDVQKEMFERLESQKILFKLLEAQRVGNAAH